MFDGIKIVLELEELPKQWYNIVPDLPKPLDPPLNPGTKQPIGPEDLMPLFPMALLQQEMSPERWIDIPEEIQEAYRYMGRPTPLYRAHRLEQILKTPAKIYYKREDLSPPGSHKPNTAIAQAYYNMKEGVERLTTETGAGQWGTALSYACALFGMQVTVYMVRCSYDQKPYRRVFMQAYGAEVLSSPTTRTQAGRKILKEMPDHPGSLGLAISEAAEDAATHEDTKYSLGSVLNHVMLHQTIIGLETKKQFAALDIYPDELYGCVGGGSNFAGFYNYGGAGEHVFGSKDGLWWMIKGSDGVAWRDILKIYQGYMALQDDTQGVGASSTWRGAFKLVHGAGGARDRVYMCLKSDSDTYSWVQIADGGA